MHIFLFFSQSNHLVSVLRKLFFSVSLGIYGFVTLKFTNYDYGCGLQRALLVAKMPYDYNIVTTVKH